MTRWTVAQLQKTDWFAPLLAQFQRELERLSGERDDTRPALEKERSELGAQIQGWLLSLAKTDLSPAVRSVIERDMEGALRRQQEIEGQLSEANALQCEAREAVDPQHVVDRLNRLAEVLAAKSPSRTNLELSLHIESIRCHQDGQVLVRTCKLGALAGATDVFTGSAEPPPPSASKEEGVRQAKPRRRAVRLVEEGEGDQAELRAAAHLAADVQRFAGLGPEWFWEDRFQMPARSCWSDEHAEEVARLRRETGWPLSKLAEHFDKSIPTIRRALSKAATTPAEKMDGAPGG
jgi:hypothetical protein